jgi:type 1 glutamine amidotransferase
VTSPQPTRPTRIGAREEEVAVIGAAGYASAYHCPPMTTALVLCGGWEGHRPAEVGRLLASLLEGEGARVDLAFDLDALLDAERLARADVVVPVWTMGRIGNDQLAALLAAVEGGTGLAGCHAMADAFREATDYQFATGGQFVAHPGGDRTEYVVRIVDREHEITRGLDDFAVRSEQYYLHVDPANHLLAATRFPVADGPHVPNGPVDMPAAWTRRHGRGRVFYSSVGHDPDVLAAPAPSTLVRRGILWAAASAG